MNKFKSILSSTLVVVAVAACNGGGGDGAAAPVPISKIYMVSASGTPEIPAYDAATTVDGDIPPDRKITGPSTLLGDNYNVDYDAFTDSLYVGTYSAKVLIWDDVSVADGDVPPSRILSGGATGISIPFGVAVDSTRNLLYVAGDHGILVFDNADTLDGDVLPLHTISGANTTFSGDESMRLALDEENDSLYVADANRIQRGVLVFDGASTLDGNVAPSRFITHVSLDLMNYASAIEIDAGRDILYIGDGSSISRGGIVSFANASTADGDTIPTHTIVGPNSTIVGVGDIFVDPVTDTLYATDMSTRSLLVWDNASTVDGDIVPSRAVSGSLSFVEGLVGAP